MATFGAKCDLDANLSFRTVQHLRGSSTGGEAGFHHSFGPGTKTVVLGGRPAMAPTPIVGAASNELSELAAGGSGANGTWIITASLSKSEKPASSSAASKLHRTFNQHCNQVKEINLVVRFEILIVKMTLLPGISGLQFCRILSNTGQYQTFGDLSLSDPPSFLL
ncbi:hypothetical protein PTTG_26490 [Puccinia triticina 1-1 BBBD Race 1]|uniref:KA1 domain-containing protein n=2 Tax=Puccinia triticina TaxID=208348 RepID=A0A180GTX3_PUCT1|nr:uncharacterized protein PtA15_10A220 [Puccinia triticina]OAV96001.1 hypothetical protein PTTG_26490 [Puccinia triticina 1-1 BBBD Race 1]WAQ88800.1 hypothetical protein PtA15_10A220 [Puccinia triticina]